MSISIIPEKPVRVMWQSTMVDIGPGTRYGHKSDVASINTDLCLHNPDETDLTLPMSFLTSDKAGNQAPAPSLRLKKETRSNIEEVELDTENSKRLIEAVVAQAQQQGQDVEAAKLYITTAIASAERHHRTLVTIKPGQKIYLRTSQRHRISSGDNDSFEFKTVAPMPQFLLVTGGSIQVTVALPRPVDNFNVQLLDCTAGFDLQKIAINDRQLVGWRWQNDPALFVKYKY